MGVGFRVWSTLSITRLALECCHVQVFLVLLLFPADLLSVPSHLIVLAYNNAHLYRRAMRCLCSCTEHHNSCGAVGSTGSCRSVVFRAPTRQVHCQLERSPGYYLRLMDSPDESIAANLSDLPHEFHLYGRGPSGTCFRASLSSS